MKDKTTAAILAIFLGGFGVHRFYLGDNNLGILYIFLGLFGISFAIGVIDGLTFLTMSNKEFDRKYNQVLYQKITGQPASVPYRAPVRKQKPVNTRWNRLAEKYGAERANKIIKKTIWMGMTKEMLLEALGKPYEIKSTVTKTISKEKWYYGVTRGARGGVYYNYEISLENNEIVGWKDL